jgi:hypothetical protein
MLPPPPPLRLLQQACWLQRVHSRAPPHSAAAHTLGCPARVGAEDSRQRPASSLRRPWRWRRRQRQPPRQQRPAHLRSRTVRGAAGGAVQPASASRASCQQQQPQRQQWKQGVAWAPATGSSGRTRRLVGRPQQQQRMRLPWRTCSQARKPARFWRCRRQQQRAPQLSMRQRSWLHQRRSGPARVNTSRATLQLQPCMSATLCASQRPQKPAVTRACSRSCPSQPLTCPTWQQCTASSNRGCWCQAGRVRWGCWGLCCRQQRQLVGARVRTAVVAAALVAQARQQRQRLRQQQQVPQPSSRSLLTPWCQQHRRPQAPSLLLLLRRRRATGCCSCRWRPRWLTRQHRQRGGCSWTLVVPPQAPADAP